MENRLATVLVTMGKDLLLQVSDLLLGFAPGFAPQKYIFLSLILTP